LWWGRGRRSLENAAPGFFYAKQSGKKEMTIATIDEQAAKIAELEAKLERQTKKATYWEELCETLRLRAQSLAHELDQLR